MDILSGCDAFDIFIGVTELLPLWGRITRFWDGYVTVLYWCGGISAIINLVSDRHIETSSYYKQPSREVSSSLTMLMRMHK